MEFLKPRESDPNTDHMHFKITIIIKKKKNEIKKIIIIKYRTKSSFSVLVSQLDKKKKKKETRRGFVNHLSVLCVIWTMIGTFYKNQSQSEDWHRI